ncbi:uncharacterized protein J8A68_001277 [[Candida] subhashii]|uniref:Serine/threonine-protein kinase psk1 n=1 Tax=[Candida] subhashii TaxID=561895 RepID=A0A8J5UR51_9ASCO|nr:uncharacterized protein J8A68_001277 [[Candida] subhashii]KAG7665221.1 hypothetical protein J8A68_001277 [[Candida] subhashii]
MAGIFNMDGYSDDPISELTTQLDSSTLSVSPRTSIGTINSTTSNNNINYRLLPDIIEPQAEDEHDDGDIHTPMDYFPSGGIPMQSNQRHRRKSSIASSYEVKISSPYAYSNHPNGIDIYKPKLSDFEPIKVLGQGSYGKVLLVREKSTGRLFAQKQLKKVSLIINESNTIHEKNYTRTLNEKEILSKVNHTNIVKLYYTFQDNDKVYLILEYLQGGELFHHLELEKFMTEKNAAFYIAQIILAIRYLHLNLNVIYRDLKPENCMLNQFGYLVLTDFGLSKVALEDQKRHSITGTAQYMAPEVLAGEEYDYAVDWWSLGCVAFDLLTGSAPYTGSNPKKILEKINKKGTLKFPFYLSSDAKDFLKKLLTVDPDKRLNIDEEFETKVKKHAFFKNIDWKQLENAEENEVMPPILPIITDPVLAENFDSEFTELAFTPQLNNNLGKDILNIKGFTYTNPKFLDTFS